MALGKESRRAGRVELARGDLGAQRPSAWKALCNVFGNDGQPHPRTVRVLVSQHEGSSDASHNTRLPCGVWWTFGGSEPWIGNDSGQANGVLRFRFGSQGVSRTLVCDLASGDYQIPSCEHLYVDCARYTPGTVAEDVATAGFADEVEVQAEVSDGTSPDFSPLIVTAPSSWGALGEGDEDKAAIVAVPQGAYAFDLYPDYPIGSNNTFEISPPGALRNFEGVRTPDGPLPVVSNSIRVQSRGGSPQTARLVFFVR